VRKILILTCWMFAMPHGHVQLVSAQSWTLAANITSKNEIGQEKDQPTKSHPNTIKSKAKGTRASPVGSSISPARKNNLDSPAPPAGPINPDDSGGTQHSTSPAYPPR
jgi:hypothetical protein